MNNERTAIYVTIEDAAEVDARSAPEHYANAFWSPTVTRQPAPLTATDLENAYQRLVNWSQPAEVDRYRRIEMEMQQRRMELPGRVLDPAAVARARELLLSHCTEEQRNDWLHQDDMRIVGSSGGNYVLSAAGVVRLSDTHIFCLQIVGDAVPTEDAVLMRKLLIETNEPEFLRLANDLTAQREMNSLMSRLIDRFLAR